MKNTLRSVATTVVGLSMGAAAHASLVEVMLNPVARANEPGLWDVEIYARCDTGRPGRTDGGIRAMQIDILSSGTGLAEPLVGVGGPRPGPWAQIQWSETISANFSTISPVYLDASTHSKPNDTDSDSDALGATFFDLNNFSLTDFGTHGQWELVGSQPWRLTTPDVPERLDAYIVAPQYFDFESGRPQSYGVGFTEMHGDGTTVGQQISPDTLHVVVWLPEPAGAAILGLLPVLGMRRRGRREEEMSRSVRRSFDSAV